MIQVVGYLTLPQGLEFLKEYVAERESRGEKTVVFSEDRLTLLAEQAICERLGGSFLTSVTTFARYLSRDGRKLSKQGSIMEIGRIIAANGDKLRSFSSRAAARNGAAAVYEMISQLAASKVTPEMLSECEMEEGVLKDKLRDLSLVYGQYLDFLREKGYLDENEYLALLPGQIRSDLSLHGANVVFLGFHSFTAQALDGVRAACECAQNVLGILPAGKNEIYTNQSVRAFAAVGEECGGIEKKMLKVPDMGRTCADILRENLFRPEVFSSAFEPFDSDGHVKVGGVADRDAEARFVAARIRRYVSEGGRYSDVSVFVPDLRKYDLSLRERFKEFSIPYYADLKKSLIEHPFAFFLTALLQCVADGGLPSSVDRALSSVYFADGGMFRNYLLKFCNYRGGVNREIKPIERIDGFLKEYGNEAEELRAQLVAARERFRGMTGLFRRKMTGKEFCQGVRSLYSRAEIGEITQKLTENCPDELQREYLAHMDRALDGVLKEAEELLGEFVLTASDFVDLLADGLTACEVSLLPLNCDEVFVGDLAQSRTGGSPIVFALGMTDEVPARGEDTALLSDRDIDRLKKDENIRIRIEPTVKEVNDRTRESIALNLCSFTRSLFLLYPEQGDAEHDESEILRYTKKIFEGTAIDDDLFLGRCMAPMSAMNELLRLKNKYLEGDSTRETRQRLSTLYAALKENPQTAARTEKLVSPTASDPFISLGEKLFFPGGDVSPTLLEQYFACPYRSFTERGLRLKEREESAVMLTDTGIFVHDVLEATAKKIDNLADEEACYRFAEDFARQQLETPRFSGMRDTLAGEYSAERLVGESAQVAVAMYAQVVGSSFRIVHTEWKCRLPEERLFGYIDRVDEWEDCVRIVDYKTGKIDVSPTSYYTGQKLQLQLYMSAVSEGKRPAGLYYFPASVSFAKEGEEPFRMSGFTNGDGEVIRNMDLTVSGTEKSRFIDASLENNSRREKVMDEDVFRDFISYSVLVAKKGQSELKQGFVAPTPYDEQCRYCACKGMCASLGKAVVREKEKKIDCKKIAAIARREKEGE